MSANRPRLGVDHPTVVPGEAGGSDDAEAPTEAPADHADDAVGDESDS